MTIAETRTHLHRDSLFGNPLKASAYATVGNTFTAWHGDRKDPDGRRDPVDVDEGVLNGDQRAAEYTLNRAAAE
jgi:hypothetical protein